MIFSGSLSPGSPLPPTHLRRPISHCEAAFHTATHCFQYLLPLIWLDRSPHGGISFLFPNKLLSPISVPLPLGLDSPALAIISSATPRRSPTTASGTSPPPSPASSSSFLYFRPLFFLFDAFFLATSLALIIVLLSSPSSMTSNFSARIFLAVLRF